MDCRTEADKRYQEALEAVERHEVTYDDGAGEAARCIALAHVAAVREQTEVQRQLLALQERVYVDFEWCNSILAALRGKEGWHFLGVSLDVDNTCAVLMGRPRALEGGGEGG